MKIINNTQRVFALDSSSKLSPALDYFTEAAAADPNADLYVMFDVNIGGGTFTHIYSYKDRSARLVCTDDNVVWYGRLRKQSADKDVRDLFEKTFRAKEIKKSWIRCVCEFIRDALTR